MHIDPNGHADNPGPGKLNLSGKPDQLFEMGPYPVPFCFNAAVASVFDDMVIRSIPNYRETILSLVRWVRQFYETGTTVYDLGCSTGTTLRALHDYGPAGLVSIGIDDSSSMLEQASEKLNEEIDSGRSSLVCSDLRKVDIKNASVVVLNYTLQFMPVKERQPLLKKIYDGLMPGGILFISEKLKIENPQLNETVTGIYEGFKFANGYSSTEIERKKEALDNVLIPNTINEHEAALSHAGFDAVETVLKWHSFASLVALKTDGSY